MKINRLTINSTFVLFLVEREDIPTIEYHLKAWCRVVASRKKRELRRVANETGNIQVIKLITKYEPINEMVCAALAGRSEKVRDLVRAGLLWFFSNFR